MKIEYFFTNKYDGNLAYHVGDNMNNVENNRKKLAKKYDYDYDSLVYMDQVHGSNCIEVNENSLKCIDDCDAIITNSINIPLMVMVADCIPILMYDDNKNVICAIHAGRNSTFLKIVEICANKLINDFLCKKENIYVVFGPSIKRCCYEVNENLKQEVENHFGKEFIFGNNIDLQGINKKLLNNLGIFNITISEVCTKCGKDDFFSYRRNKNTGRFAGIIMIKD